MIDSTYSTTEIWQWELNWLAPWARLSHPKLIQQAQRKSTLLGKKMHTSTALCGAIHCHREGKQKGWPFRRFLHWASLGIIGHHSFSLEGYQYLLNSAKPGSLQKISPKSIPNSEKQKQLPNTQWVKYVYCPALFTLEIGRARCNHSTNTLWKHVFPKAFAILWPVCPKLVRRVFFPKNCCPPHSSLHLPNIHHPHLLCPLHLLYHLLHHLL